jgi:hypothetical protein
MNAQFSSLVIAVVMATLAILASSAKAEAAIEGESRVLQYSSVWKGLVRLLWAFPVVITLIAMISPPKAEDKWIPLQLVVGFSALMLPLTLEVFKRRLEFTQGSISSRSPWSQPVSVAWDEIAAASWNSLTSQVELKTTRGQKLVVSQMISGRESLAQELERQSQLRVDRQLPPLPGLEDATKKLRQSFGA